MENTIKFTVAIENLERKIAKLNIQISKDSNNQSLKDELTNLLNEKNTLLTGTDKNILESLISKYGNSVHKCFVNCLLRKNKLAE